MAIKADHSALPRGNPPSTEPRFGALLAATWAAEHMSEEDRPFAIEGARLRASWAGKCARDIGYRLAGVEQSNPAGIAAHFRMRLGSLVHEDLQPIFAKMFPGASIEHVADWSEMGLPGASHVDVFLVTEPDKRRTVIEIKTVGGYGFKTMVGARGPAQGPKFTALLQGALSGRALHADDVTIIYLSMENLSPREAEKIGADEIGRFYAEWTYTVDQLAEITDREIARLGKVLDVVDAGELPPRQIPGELPPGARVTNPETGAWTLDRGGNVLEAGSTFFCGYCDYKDQCIADGAS